MNIGKLTDEQLESLVLSRLPKLSANTLSGAGIGADCAWIRAGDDMIVTSSDPITAEVPIQGLSPFMSHAMISLRAV